MKAACIDAAGLNTNICEANTVAVSGIGFVCLHCPNNVGILMQVRVKLVTKDDSIRVTDAPLAVPTKLGRKGLSEVVNHLLGRSGDQHLKLDFLVEDKLLRFSLGQFLQTTGISTVSWQIVDVIIHSQKRVYDVLPLWFLFFFVGKHRRH